MPIKLWLCLLLLLPMATHAQLEVRISDSRKSNIYMDALVWLLDKSGKEYQLIHTDHPTSTQQRKVIMLRKKEIDVMYAGHTAALEQQLTAIRIPITRGLIGHRLLVVHAQALSRYQGIKTLAALQQNPALLGFGWPEVALFSANHIPVYERIYDEIFAAVNNGHRGFFARGVLEVYGELADRPAMNNLRVEPNILLRYPSAVFFFVHPDNLELQQALKEGFNKGYADGSYVQFLYSHPLVRQAQQQYQLDQRQMIELKNDAFADIYHSIPQKYWHTGEFY